MMPKVVPLAVEEQLHCTLAYACLVRAMHTWYVGACVAVVTNNKISSKQENQIRVCSERCLLQVTMLTISEHKAISCILTVMATDQVQCRIANFDGGDHKSGTC